MRIISPFKDYYDSVSGQYLDKEITYNRSHSVVDIKDREDIPVVARFVEKMGDSYYNVNFSIVGFCGQLYPVVTIRNDKEKRSVGFYYLDDFKKYVKENNISIRDEQRYRNKWWRWSSYNLSIQEVELFFQNREKFEKLNRLFSKYNTPVFVVRTEGNAYNGLKISINPMLSNYSFVKVKDPYSAHQDLYTYVSGHLNQQSNEMVEISNEDKIHKHGFDKHSFRKMPTKGR